MSISEYGTILRTLCINPKMNMMWRIISSQCQSEELMCET